MTDWRIGDVRITRIEEVSGPFFIAKEFFPHALRIKAQGDGFRPDFDRVPR